MSPSTSSLFRLGIIPLALFFAVFFAYPVLHFLWGSLVVDTGGTPSCRFAILPTRWVRPPFSGRCRPRSH